MQSPFTITQLSDTNCKCGLILHGASDEVKKQILNNVINCCTKLRTSSFFLNWTSFQRDNNWSQRRLPSVSQGAWASLRCCDKQAVQTHSRATSERQLVSTESSVTGWKRRESEGMGPTCRGTKKRTRRSRSRTWSLVKHAPLEANDSMEQTPFATTRLAERRRLAPRTCSKTKRQYFHAATEMIPAHQQDGKRTYVLRVLRSEGPSTHATGVGGHGLALHWHRNVLRLYKSSWSWALTSGDARTSHKEATVSSTRRSKCLVAALACPWYGFGNCGRALHVV